MSSEIQRLQQKLEEAETVLQKAAQYGLQLLDDKMELQNKLEDQRVEMTGVIENLEQEKYSLQRDVELKSRMLESLHSEFESVKNQQKHLLEQQQMMLERNHAVERDDSRNKMEKLKGDLDEARLLEKQLRHKLEVQAQSLASKTEELRRMSECSQETMSSEILELQVQKMDLESAMATLEQMHQELKYKEQQLELANCILQRQLETLENAKEEKEKEVVSLYRALEKSREANQDLQVQLDQLTQQAQDPNSKGNSLFSEVEDRRAEMERQMISVKVQYQSLQKQHSFTKQQMLRMKVQISNLMQLQGMRADPAQLERLQFMLSEKNSEIETLMKKVQQLEKAEVALGNQSTGVSTKEMEFVDETYYTDLLKMQLSNSKKAAEKLKEELSMARMKSLSESQRVLELERKLFAAENALKQGRIDITRLQVKIEELQLKYEPNEVKKGQAQKCKREKFPVNVPAESEQSSMDTSDVKNEPSGNKADDGETAPSSTENKARSSQAPEKNQVSLRETKCVRISENAPVSIPNSPRSPVKDCSNTGKNKMLKLDEEGETWRSERCKKYQAPVHVDSENTMEKQCAQQ